MHSALARWVRRLVDSQPLPESAEAWIVEANRIFAVAGQPDRGLFFFLLLNLVTLEPGQGLFLSAGTPHAYLRGAGTEVMTNSDNVLRAGLTEKHVDPRELMSNPRFESQRPQVLGTPVGDGANIAYSTAADAFELHQLGVGITATPERIASGSIRWVSGAEDLSVALVAHGFEDLSSRGLPVSPSRLRCCMPWNVWARYWPVLVTRQACPSFQGLFFFTSFRKESKLRHLNRLYSLLQLDGPRIRVIVSDRSGASGSVSGVQSPKSPKISIL